MCRLTMQLQQMSNDVKGDAILIQPRESVGAAPDYNLATGIIRRVKDAAGCKWSFSTILSIADTPLISAGFIGEIAEVVENVKYQFGGRLFHNEFFPVSYQDASFPPHLIP